MTSLAEIELSPDLQLTGAEVNADVAYSVRDLLGGPAVIQIESRETGAELSLTAVYSGNRKMGHFCSWQIDALKAICAKANPVILEHPAGSFTVFILRFDVIQNDEREQPDPNKKFHGSIILQEV